VKRLGILISGRGSNMEAVSRACVDGPLAGLAEVAVVGSNKRKAAGLEIAAGLGLPTRVVLSRGKDREIFDAELIEALEPFAPDFVVLAGFMRLLSPLFVARYPQRIVNIHPADTRAYQGLHAYPWAWEQGLDSTQVTVHLVDEGMDTGPVLSRTEVDLRGAADVDEVTRRGLAVEHRCYAETLARLCRGEFSTPSD
jgi:phosphoribosylglycinamide formyltransferase-1